RSSPRATSRERRHSRDLEYPWAAASLGGCPSPSEQIWRLGGRDERRQSCEEICASSTILAMSRVGREHRGVGSPRWGYSGRPALRSPSATRCSCCWYCGLVSASGTGENRRNVDTLVSGRRSR